MARTISTAHPKEPDGCRMHYNISNSESQQSMASDNIPDSKRAEQEQQASLAAVGNHSLRVKGNGELHEFNEIDTPKRGC